MLGTIAYNKNPLLVEPFSVPGTVLDIFYVKIFDPYNNSRTHHYLTNEKTEARRGHRHGEGQN